MHIDLTSIDALTNALDQKGTGLEVVGGFSLGAAMELAVWVHQASEPPALVEKWSVEEVRLAESLRLLRGGRPVEPDIRSAPVMESFRSICSAQSLAEDGWEWFLQGFAAALKESGFQDGWNQAIAGVFGDMADNVVQHSVLGSDQRMNGIAGYSVGARRMAFTVADTGIGAVRSLRDNPHYAHVTSGRLALDLIAREKASRRTDQGEGKGFSSLFVQLAAMNGRIRLRSADGVFMMEGTLAGCSPITRSLHLVPGFQISVECEI